ncbi:MAG: 30S ribosome-binding factor RbfA [Candidatus Eremiobacteraeota bacterium]|nr:30S ribosome-binding factor RbfA [Candidatus Eremiobacteraeota bacterium]NNM92467.1 30S ribosome-binding factor RbfA [Candidatus Eremiobacteraeota bacterium]
MKAQRLARIDHEIQRILGILITQELKDPRLGFTTVTRVEVTDDLRFCKVHVSVIGDRHAARQTLDALESAKGFLRGELGHRIDLRYTPELLFEEDRSVERAIELARTMREDAMRRAPAPPVEESQDARTNEDG